MKGVATSGISSTSADYLMRHKVASTSSSATSGTSTLNNYRLNTICVRKFLWFKCILILFRIQRASCWAILSLGSLKRLGLSLHLVVIWLLSSCWSVIISSLSTSSASKLASSSSIASPASELGRFFLTDIIWFVMLLVIFRRI